MACRKNSPGIPCCDGACDCDLVRDDLPASVAVLGETILRADWVELSNCCWRVERNIEDDWRCFYSDPVAVEEVEHFVSLEWYGSETYIHTGQDDPPTDTATVCLPLILMGGADYYRYQYYAVKLFVRNRRKKFTVYLYKASVDCTFEDPQVLIPCRWVMVVITEFEFQTMMTSVQSTITSCDGTSYHSCFEVTDTSATTETTDATRCSQLAASTVYTGYAQREVFLDEMVTDYDLTAESQIDCAQVPTGCVDFNFESANTIITSTDPGISGTYDDVATCQATTIARNCYRYWCYEEPLGNPCEYYSETTVVPGFEVISTTESWSYAKLGTAPYPFSGCTFTAILYATHPGCYVQHGVWPNIFIPLNMYTREPHPIDSKCVSASTTYTPVAYVEKSITLDNSETWTVVITW